MRLQVKMTMIEEIDEEMGLKKELTFTQTYEDNIAVCIYDEDTSDSTEINVSKNDLIKALTVLLS